ncbi:MAG: CRTAC1 family protein [Planctomycetes bacterium]|nr:CRTAC1 family protein [Planctomycetota bacterium]
MKAVTALSASRRRGVLAGLLALFGCGPDGTGPGSGGAAAPAAATAATGLVDATVAAGLPLEFPAIDGSYALVEIMGPGVALFDADGDHDLDLLERRAPPPGRASEPAPDRFWRREADGRYVDATAASGLADPGYGQGVAIGDVDNDGDNDVYCANYGQDALFLNRGDGTFVDATAAAGFSGADEWTCAAAFFDADRDGDLDLFLAHYVEFDASVVCRRQDSAPEYCGPLAFPPTVDSLWINDGGGRFTEEGRARGISVKGAALGVVCADFTGDGECDVYVANDAGNNHLWINQGGGRFIEDGIERGVAVNRFGKPEGSMGIAIGDLDGNGHQDLLVTHIAEENNTLYLAEPGGGSHRDATPQAGMARHDLPRTGFGVAFLDLELDGDLDVAVVNGRVRRGRPEPGCALRPFWVPFADRNLLFLNDGATRFTPAPPAAAGSFTAAAELGRGLAVGDLDDDGDLDLVTSQSIGPLRIHRNELPRAGRWLRVRAVTGKRDALGAEVRLHAGGRERRALALAASSYASSGDPRVHFGLGDVAAFDAIEVRWPSGRIERFDGGPVDRTLELVEGTGRAP